MMTKSLLQVSGQASQERNKEKDERKTLNIREFSGLATLRNSQMIVPLQESLTASLPPASSSGLTHKPFPSNAPTFAGWLGVFVLFLLAEEVNNRFS
jgi:hypothetical protein